MSCGTDTHVLPQAERYELALPPFTRIAWVSEEARRVWAPRLHAIADAWREIEWLVVAEGRRPCALGRWTPADFSRRAGEWAERGLVSLPLGVEPAPTQHYSACVPSAHPDGKVVTPVVIARTAEALRSFNAAWAVQDHRTMGVLLGFPSCCVEFFQAVWREAGCIDTTWPMAGRTSAAVRAQDGRFVDVHRTSWETNVLWRWLGVRAVPHLPCCFDCEESAAMARALLAVGHDCGYEREVRWLEALLRGPLEWSALHGIAEIRTLVAKVATRTDATRNEFVVRLNAIGSMAGDVPGRRFPYNIRKQPADSDAVGVTFFTRPSLAPPTPDWLFRDNGFTSFDAMERLHRPIAELARDALSGTAGSVIDLGCGNGVLVNRICESRPGLVPYGIEIAETAFTHISEVCGAFSSNFVLGDMFAPDHLPAGRFALAILMVGRLLEVPAERADVLRRWLAAHADRVLVYVYPGWSSEPLKALVESADFRWQDGASDALQALVAVQRGAGDAPT